MGKRIVGRKPDENWSVEKSTLFAEIRRVGKNRIFLMILILLPILFWDTMPTAVKSAMYFRGAQKVDTETLAAISGPEDLTLFSFSMHRETSEEFDEDPTLKRRGVAKNGSCYVQIAVDDYIDTGITVENGLTVYSFAVLPNGKMLLMRRSAVVDLENQKGTIGYLPLDLQEITLQSAAENGGEINPADVLPLFMDATNMVFDSLGAEIAFSVGLLLTWGVALFFAFRVYAFPEKHGAYKAVFIRAGNVEDNIRALEEELLDPDTYTVGSTTVTKTWRLTRKLFSFKLEPRDWEKR